MVPRCCLGFGTGVVRYNLNVWEGLPNALLSSRESGADAIIAWNETQRTLYLLWKYTEERRDWIIDANAAKTFAFPGIFDFMGELLPGEQQLSEVVPDVQVHQGFLTQFDSLAVNPGSPEDDLIAAIQDLSADTQPRRVVVSGFSLGGALSELSGVWAAQQWPAADVMIINQGAPKVGNQQFAQLLQATVGRAYKYVYRYDQVPSLAPLPGYVQPHGSIWIIDDEVLLQPRPAMTVRNTTWQDHTCDFWTVPDSGELIVGYVPQLYNASAPNVPAWVFNATTKT